MIKRKEQIEGGKLSCDGSLHQGVRDRCVVPKISVRRGEESGLTSKECLIRTSSRLSCLQKRALYTSKCSESKRVERYHTVAEMPSGPKPVSPRSALFDSQVQSWIDNVIVPAMVREFLSQFESSSNWPANSVVESFESMAFSREGHK